MEASLKLVPFRDTKQLGILLYNTDSTVYALDLWVSIGPLDSCKYMAINTDNIFNVVYLISEYGLWTFVDYKSSCHKKYLIFEINLDELKKYDHEGVENFMRDNRWNS